MLVKKSYRCYACEMTADDPYDPKYMPIGTVLCSAFTFAEAEQMAKNIVQTPCVVWRIERIIRQNPLRKTYFIPSIPEKKRRIKKC